MRVHIRIVGRLDKSHLQEGTVTIDRSLSLFSVRPLRRRKVYTLPLSVVADIVVSRMVKAEVAEQRRSKRRKS